MSDQTMSGLEIADPQVPFVPVAATDAPAQSTDTPPGGEAPTDPKFRKDAAPSAEEMAFGLAGLPNDASEAKAGLSSSKPRKVVRFVESEREKVVVLAHQVECEGFVYERIVVRRLNVSDYIGHFNTPEAERGRFPCFFDDRGEAVPEEVLDALSLDDSTEVNEAYQHFLPASFRDGREP